MLVTGCAGFIGSHLSEELIARGHDVIGVDCFTDYYSREIKERNLHELLHMPRFTLCETDLAETDLRPLLEGTDVVFHLAAQPGVRGSWGTHFEEYVRNNILVTQRLLEATKPHRERLRKFVYSSSSSIYGNAESLPTNECLRPEPVSPYAVSKLAGEQLAMLYWRNYGVPAVALRYFTVYGPRQRPDMAFHRFIHRVLAGEAVDVFGSGEQTRDFTFIDDVVAANIAAAESRTVGLPINIGGGTQASVNHAIKLIGELLGTPVKVKYHATESGDVRDTSADTWSAKKLLGFEPRVDLQCGLAREVEWLAASTPRRRELALADSARGY
jgi:UDP-glucose 4-epimerase